MKKLFISSITTFSFLLLPLNVSQAQVFYNDSSPYEVQSIQGGASWIKDPVSGDIFYDNAGTVSTHRALLYSTDAYQSDDGFRLTIEYTTGSTADVEGHNLSFGLISDETVLSNYAGFNPFSTNTTVFSIGANLSTDEDPAARGLNFTNGTERITLDESGTRVQFKAGVATKVTIELNKGGYWCYRINDIYEASGVLLNGIDLRKSYRVVLYGQGDNGDRKSIQSIKLEKGYAAGERATKLRGTWNPDVPMSQINDFKALGSVYLGITSGATQSARHSVPHKLLESLSHGDVDASGNRINLVVPPWGDLSLDEPENDSFLKKLLEIKAAGLKVKIYHNSENFVGRNAAEYEVAVVRWKEWCNTNAEAQAFINSQPFHTGVWNRITQQYEVAYNEDGTEKYPNRKYMFCYAEYVLKDYSLRYGRLFDSWIFDSADDMRKNGDNATSGILEEQRIYQAFANACHAGNPDVPLAFNNGRSTTSYDGYPFAVPVHFEDFTFGHAFGGNSDHANKEGGTFDRNYQFVKRMVETNGYVHAGGDWTWDDKIVGNFHSKVATRSWNYGETQAWSEEEFVKWNLEAVRAGGSITWSGSKHEVDGKTLLRPWAYDLYKVVDDLLAPGPKVIDYNSPFPAAAPPQPEVFQLRPDDITTMIAKRGILSGTEKEDQAVWGFDTPEDEVAWIVNAPEEDDYTISVIYSIREQVNMEVSSGESVLSVPSMVRTWENRPYLWRQEFPGTLHLKAGENRISFRLPDMQTENAPGSRVDRDSPKFAQGVTEDFHLLSIELGTPEARKAQLERAREMKSDASWMQEGKYGLFVHWSALSYPYYGDEPRAAWFQKSVEIFDVKVFADAVEKTGAAWVNFTATHKGFYWPAPNAAVDDIIPGRTTERDLLGEIIDELDRRGIRTMLYLHTAYNGYESEFRKASGALDWDRDRFSDNIAAILRDCSLRYGKKLFGFGYIDGALHFDYPLDPHYESWAGAIKAGNPSSLVGFSSNRGPVVSPFSDLSATDGMGRFEYPDPMLIGPGCQLGDVTTAVWCYMDGWFTYQPMNGEWKRSPVHSTEEYVDFFQEMAEKEIPISINLVMTADVTAEHPIFNPECMAVMEEVRKAIRGK